MRVSAPFQPGDMAALDERLLSHADHVWAMSDIYALAGGNTDGTVIGMRHDVDDNPGSLQTAVRLAEWEAERGYRSTYYLLHDSHYWDDEMPAAAALLEQMGHEVGLHVNAIAEAIRQQRDPFEILTDALSELRATGVQVVGCAAHGDRLCRDGAGRVRFCNDEIFVECRRPELGAAERSVDGVTISPRPMAEFGLCYDAAWLPRAAYLSDSGGQWRNGYSDEAFAETAAAFPYDGPLVILQHPDWWADAFAAVPA